MNPSDLFNQTLAQFIAWLVSFGIAAGVAYVLGWAFPNLNPTIAKIVFTAVTAGLIAVVTALAQFIPQTWLDMKLFDVIIALFTLIVGWTGTLFGQFKATEHRALSLQHQQVIRQLSAAK